MKRNTIIKTVVVSVVLSAILAGCGSVVDEVNKLKDDIKKDVEKQFIEISGKAVDGYLQYATVCLDISKDGYCQEEEPSTQTGKNGSFTLNISPQIQESDDFNEAMLLVYGGKDVDTGADFRGKLLAPADAEIVNISPITTLVAKAVQREFDASKNLTKEEMREKIKASKKEVARIFDIDEDEITLDPVAVKDAKPYLIKHALKIQKAVEAMTDASENNDDIEKVYERLSENLKKAKASKGMDSLLDESFKDDVARTTVAKEITRNIEKAFEKLDGDLAKIGYITKEDLKRVKKRIKVERDEDDDLFKDNHDWDASYIKSGLEDIGIEIPTLAQIEAIKEKIGTDIRPGIIFDYEDNFKNSDNKELKEIYRDIEKEKERKKAQKEREKAKKDGNRVKFEKGMKLYEYDRYDRNIEYSEIYIGENDTITFKEFELRDENFVEVTGSEEEGGNEVEYILRNGNWEQRLDNAEINYRLNEKGVLILPSYNMHVFILDQKNISELFIPILGETIPMPQGSKESYLGFKQFANEYILHNKMKVNATLSEYIGKQCKIEYFTKTDGTICDNTTVKGKTSDGKWSVETKGDKKVLVVENSYLDDYDKSIEIYSELNGALFNGYKAIKGFDKDPELNYNGVAIEAIKKALIDSDIKKDDYYGDTFSTPVEPDTSMETGVKIGMK